MSFGFDFLMKIIRLHKSKKKIELNFTKIYLK